MKTTNEIKMVAKTQSALYRKEEKLQYKVCKTVKAEDRRKQQLAIVWQAINVTNARLSQLTGC